MSFFISDAQGIVGGDVKPPPELDKIFLSNSRLEDIRFNLFPKGHSIQNRRNRKHRRRKQLQSKNSWSPGEGKGWQRRWEHTAKSAESKTQKETEKDLGKSTKKAKSNMLVTTDLFIVKEKVLDGQIVPLRWVPIR